MSPLPAALLSPRAQARRARTLRGSQVQLQTEATIAAGVHLTWRSARRIHSDAEVWTSPPASSGPAAGLAGPGTPRPKPSSRSPGGCSTGARRWSPSCWAVKRTETRRLRPSCQVFWGGWWWGGQSRTRWCGRAVCAATTAEERRSARSARSGWRWSLGAHREHLSQR